MSETNIAYNIIYYEKSVSEFEEENEKCGLRKRIPKDSIDLLIEDPPSAHNSKEKNVISGNIDIKKENYYSFILNLLKESERILKPNGTLILFNIWDNLWEIENAIKETNLTIINHIEWSFSFGKYTKKRYADSHYDIYFLVKDEKDYTFNKIRKYMADTLLIGKKRYRNIKLAGRKIPNKIILDLIKTHSNKGDLVVDPFLGNGTTMYCCILLGRKYIGFEANKNPEIKIIHDYWRIKAENRAKSYQDFIDNSKQQLIDHYLGRHKKNK